MSNLPNTLPGKARFEAAGFENLEDVIALKGDYSTVPGIGAATAEKINAFLNSEETNNINTQDQVGVPATETEPEEEPEEEPEGDPQTEPETESEQEVEPETKGRAPEVQKNLNYRRLGR